MNFRNRKLRLTLAAFILLATVGSADAARGRYHYGPTDASGALSLKPSSACGTPGEQLTIRGKFCVDCAPHPNCHKCLVHPCTGQTIMVPLELPEGTPIIYHKRNRVSFNYGSYAIDVVFLPDGSVDVVYNSGLLRSL